MSYHFLPYAQDQMHLDGAEAADPSRAGYLQVAQLHHRTGLWADEHARLDPVLAAGPSAGPGGVVAVVQHP